MFFYSVAHNFFWPAIKINKSYSPHLIFNCRINFFLGCYISCNQLGYQWRYFTVNQYCCFCVFAYVCQLHYSRTCWLYFVILFGYFAVSSNIYIHIDIYICKNYSMSVFKIEKVFRTFTSGKSIGSPRFPACCLSIPNRN